MQLHRHLHLDNNKLKHQVLVNNNLNNNRLDLVDSVKSLQALPPHLDLVLQLLLVDSVRVVLAQQLPLSLQQADFHSTHQVKRVQHLLDLVDLVLLRVLRADLVALKHLNQVVQVFLVPISLLHRHPHSLVVLNLQLRVDLEQRDRPTLVLDPLDYSVPTSLQVPRLVFSATRKQEPQVLVDLVQHSNSNLKTALHCLPVVV